MAQVTSLPVIIIFNNAGPASIDYNDAPPPPPPPLPDPLHPRQRPPKHPRLPPSRPQSLTSNRPNNPAHNHHRAIPPSLHLWPSRSRCRNARAKGTPHSHRRRIPRGPARRPDDLPRPRTTSRIPHHRPQAPCPQRKVLREPARKCSDADLRALRRRDPTDGTPGRVGGRGQEGLRCGCAFEEECE